MSAPDTNIAKQTRRHRPALYGIAAAVVIAAGAAVVFFGSEDLTPEEQAAPALVGGTD